MTLMPLCGDATPGFSKYPTELGFFFGSGADPPPPPRHTPLETGGRGLGA